MCQYVDPSTEVPITDAIFQVAEPFFEGRAAVRIDGLFGFIDTSGAIVVQPQFVEVSRFRNGLAEVSDGVSVSLLDVDGAIVTTTDFRRAIPISATVLMAFIDDREQAAKFESSQRYIRPALWREPRNENVPVYSEATLFSLDAGRIETPPVRAIQLIPNTTEAFWLQIAEPGDGWSRYDWGLMDVSGDWIIGPGIMDVRPLPNGLSLIFDPPHNFERKGHDSYFGYELASNQMGWEAVVDSGGNLIGSSYFENVDVSDDLTPLIWKDDQWFEIIGDGSLSAFDGEPAAGNWRFERDEPPRVMDHWSYGDPVVCAENVRLFSAPNQRPDSLTAALDIRWGLMEADGTIMVPAVHRYITCPQHGVALVPNVDARQWCPVGPVEQARTSSTCQTSIWDGWMREFSRRETLDPDPFISGLMWRERQLLWSQFPEVVEQPGWTSQ